MKKNIKETRRLAILLANRGVKVFSFLEFNDHRAEEAFKLLSEITGGTFAKFGSELPLAELCEGVALLTGKGKKGVKQIKNEQVKRLLLEGPDNSKPSSR